MKFLWIDSIDVSNATIITNRKFEGITITGCTLEIPLNATICGLQRKNKRPNYLQLNHEDLVTLLATYTDEELKKYLITLAATLKNKRT